MKRFVLPVVAVMLLGGCAGLSADDSADSDGPGADGSPLIGSPVEGESAALGLVNLWRVSGAEGEGDATWLRLDSQEFQLWGDCGVFFGSWSATNTLFLADVVDATDGCASNERPAVEWLESVTGFGSGVNGYDLLAADGNVVASLSVDGAPQPIPAVEDALTHRPEVTDEVRRLFSASATLPDAVSPVATDALPGRWVPTTPIESSDPFALFEAGGVWSGSDGCNGNGGRWAVSDSGEFLATVGPSTLMYCEGAAIPFWLAHARSAGTIAEGALVFFDTEGAELGRLIAE